MRDVLMFRSHYGPLRQMLPQFYKWGIWGSKRLTDTAGEELSPELSAALFEYSDHVFACYQR